MKRLVTMIALVCVLMVIIAGSGAFLVSNILIAKSKVDAVAGVAQGVSLTLSEQIALLNSILDKMVQEPEVINAFAQNNPELITPALKKIETDFPGVISVKYLMSEAIDQNAEAKSGMGFADLDIAKQTFSADPVSAVQGENDGDRHLAIARKVIKDNVAIAVVLAGLKYDFIKRTLLATHLDKGYIELRQGNLVLASVGAKKDEKKALDDDAISVPNTGWQLFYESSAAPTIGEFSLMASVVLIPAMAVALGFVMGYRKFSELVTEEISWLTKAFKDIVTDRSVGDYPVKLGETKSLITTMAQFKRVINDKSFNV